MLGRFFIYMLGEFGGWRNMMLLPLNAAADVPAFLKKNCVMVTEDRTHGLYLYA